MSALATAPRRTAVSQIAIRGPALDMLVAADIEPSRTRIRPFQGSIEDSNGLIAMATMVRHPNGSPLRLGRAVLDHEHGTYATPKSAFPLVWQGMAHQEALIAADVDRDVAGVSTESARLEFMMDGAKVSYTADVALRMRDGRERFLEIKRDERDLEDPAYRLKLAHVTEICRRCGIRFDVVLRSEIFASDRHRRNACLVASRAFATVDPVHLRRLDGHRRTVGDETTLGELAHALAPGAPVLGEALVHALVVRGRVDLDLAGRLLPSAAVTIH